MSRTRRRPHITDDPRAARKLRQKSGIDLLHEEPWFGFNVADKMPTRGASDPAANPFLGLPGGVLEVDAVSDVELASGDTDGQRAVGTAHAKNQFLAGRHFIGTSAPYRLPSGVKVAAGTDIDGTLDIAQLPANIPANNVPALQDMNGTLTNSQLPDILKAKLPNDVVYGNSRGQLSYASLIDKPHLHRFLTANDIENKANKGWVQDYVRKYVTKHVKPTARR